MSSNRSNSEKELIASDGRQSNMRVFCVAHVKRKRIVLMVLLSLLAILTLVSIFGIYAVIKVSLGDSHLAQIDSTIDPIVIEAAELLRKKRAVNEIIKFSETIDDKYLIKRDTDYENIENFLDSKYREVNKNDAKEEMSVEDQAFIQKRSSELKNSIRKLEDVVELNEYLLNTLIRMADDSDESTGFITKDLDNVGSEIDSLDQDIIDVLETSQRVDNSIHKRIRHKRETDFSSPGIDPVAIKLFFPLLEEKKREKRQVQHQLAEVRDEFIRCRKSATGENDPRCDGIYIKVLDRFRDIRKKFREIEDIVEEMENFHPSRSAELEDRKKKKRKDKKSSEESDESSEEKKKEKTTTEEPAMPSTTFETTENIFDETTSDTTTDEPTTEESTTIFETTDVAPRVQLSEEIPHTSELIVQPKDFIEDESSTISSKMLSAASESTTTETCPASAFTNEIRGHPKFHEDIDEKHSSLKFSKDHHSIADLLANKYERSQRPEANTLSDLFDGAELLIRGAEGVLPVIMSDPPQLGKSQSTQSTSAKRSDVIGASGPFLALCDQISRQTKQSQPQPQPLAQQTEHQNTFVPIQVPLSSFANAGIQFPVTGETSKATSKVFMNPNFNMMQPAMQYPMCFVNYPQYRMPQQQMYYPGLIPLTMPGGYYIPSGTGTNYRPVQLPTTNQPTYRDESEPTYCTFLGSDVNNLPAHIEETTEQPSTVSLDEIIEELADEPVKINEEPRASAFNVPSQFDIIYATYPNQIFAMNHSMQHHHCDAGKLPCFGSNQCINKARWCDSKVDCLDASDETACSCKARLAESRICDGFVDCPMGSDELGCFGCGRFQHSCYNSRKEFEDNGESSSLMCYSSIEKCDGFNNCRNGKDESECSMIVRHLGGILSFAVSHSEGILHQNFKGRWYPVCRNPLNWAIDACEMENGKLNVDPQISIKSFQIPGPFIQPNFNQHNQAIDSDPTFSETCQLDKLPIDENQVIFVRCPPPPCGVSKQPEHFINPGRREKGNSSESVTDSEARIVGGDDAEPMQYPFIVAIYKDGNFHCGGSIYNEHWIITAAHCTRSFENHFYEVRSGILRRSSFSPTAQISKVSHVIRHEDYDRSIMKHDIALMKLKQHLSFNRWVRPICLPSKSRLSIGNDWKFGPAPGTLCSAIGWGAIREKGPDPDSLKVVDVPIIAKCKHSYDQETNSICAGETFGTRDACQGDSGGPFVCKSLDNPSELYLAGIVSHGEGCARANEPGVYTRVALYLDWIRGNTNERQTLPSNVPHQSCPGHVCVWGGSKCISSAERCDGYVDCLGGEDEIECTINWLDLLLGSSSNATETAKSTSIDPIKMFDAETGGKIIKKKDIHHDSFHCTKIPQVIHSDQRCDKIFDCEDGSDEENCTCRDRLRSSFAKLICDGNVDCSDLTDENECLKCNSTQFACPHSNICIDKSLHCNGEIDCKFREDELECLALTDGSSVMLDINGKPFLHSKGIVSQNIGSTWKILCDDIGDFHDNGLKIANEVCNVIGFKSAKSAKVVEMISSNVTDASDLSIDIRNKIPKTRNIINKEKCAALEIECVVFQSNSFAVAPIQHIKIKNNSTTSTKIEHQHGPEIIFVPVNSTDQTKVVVKPVNTTTSHDLSHLQDYEWPWNAEIFINGDLIANGILLDKSWVLVEKNIMGSNVEPLHDNHVVVLFGNTKSQLSIQSPYEQLVKVDCIIPVNDSNVMLLRLEHQVDFNRQVLPSFLPTANETEPDSTCLAIALNSHQMTKSLGLKIIKSCKNDVNLVCYQQVANASHLVKCDGGTKHQTATIVCKSKSSGWYPKAFHQLKDGFCDFQEPTVVLGLHKGCFQQMQNIIDHPCEKCRHNAVPIKCSTHRCSLGKCLQRHQLCNGINDCHDGSDEKPEVCLNIPERDRLCKPSDFYCRNGHCVDKSKFCDHINDCGDKSDEPSECTCFSYLKATDPAKLCDGIRHCWDRTDEDPTYCGTKCSVKTSFKCGNSLYCVPLEMVCDKRADCPNGADEQFCNGIYQSESNNDYGEIMQRSFGIWHTKCFPKSSPPSQEELEILCKKLGFKNTSKAIGKIIDLKDTNSSETNVEFKTFNATKVIAYSKFSAVKINDGFTVHLRPSKPLAKLVSWGVSDHLNCHRMELKCIEEKN